MEVQNMQSGGVLVFGCLDGSANGGLIADERAIAAQGVPVTAISTGLAIRNAENDVEVAEAGPSIFMGEIDDAIRRADCKVVKMGALFSVESIKMVSSVLQQRVPVISVIDVEPFFNTGSARKPEVVMALRKHILPSILLLSGTVPEVKTLLDESGIPVGYPRGLPDVLSIANTLRSLGPKYVMIKKEFVDKEDSATTLHYVLSGDTEPLTMTYRYENPKGVFGASDSIPPAIAAHLAKGLSVPDAVSASFNFVEEMLKGGDYFN